MKGRGGGGESASAAIPGGRGGRLAEAAVGDARPPLVRALPPATGATGVGAVSDVTSVGREGLSAVGGDPCVGAAAAAPSWVGSDSSSPGRSTSALTVAPVLLAAPSSQGGRGKKEGAARVRASGVAARGSASAQAGGSGSVAGGRTDTTELTTGSGGSEDAIAVSEASFSVGADRAAEDGSSAGAGAEDGSSAGAGAGLATAEGAGAGLATAEGAGAAATT